jgi:hypothetical protein
MSACRPGTVARTAMTEGLPEAVVSNSLGRQVIHCMAEPDDIAGSVLHPRRGPGRMDYGTDDLSQRRQLVRPMTAASPTDKTRPHQPIPPGAAQLGGSRRLASMVTEADIRLADGRTLHAYEIAADRIASSPDTPGSPVAVFWLHGSPNIGSPPGPRTWAPSSPRPTWLPSAATGHGWQAWLARPWSRVTGIPRGHPRRRPAVGVPAGCHPRSRPHHARSEGQDGAMRTR